MAGQALGRSNKSPPTDAKFHHLGSFFLLTLLVCMNPPAEFFHLGLFLG